MTAARAAADRVSLGVDFGATGVRALYAGPGERVHRLDVPARGWPWLVCAPAGAGVLPVAFPSLKSLLSGGRSVPWREGTADADTVVTRMLRALRERVEEQASAFVAQTVISVPASFLSSQRQALRDAAREAGLAPVRLISDSMAAVMGHTTDRDSGTFLVYGMGYDGFELGLVRGVRGHCRALRYDGATTSGGRAFDEAVLASAVRLLRAHRGPASVTGAPAEVWLGHRERAQAARQALSGPEDADASAATDFAALTLDLGTGPALRMGVTRPNMDAFLEPHVRRTVRRAQTLLDEAGVAGADVDTLLLVGGGTRMEQVRAGVAGLGRRTAYGVPELLALGALKHAVRLGGGGASSSGSSGAAALEEGLLEPADPHRDTLADAPALTATLFPPDDPPDPRRRDVAQARHLAEQGRRQEAVALLRDIVAEARELLVGLGAEVDASRGAEASAGATGASSAEAYPGTTSGGTGTYAGREAPDPAGVPEQRAEPEQKPNPEPERKPDTRSQSEQKPQPERKPDSEPESAPTEAPPAPMSRRAVRQLSRARDLLGLGQYEHAVQTSHAAWQEATPHASRADLLDAMIDVHCAAAMADMAPERFADAERWLRCAYGHDPTNERVRGLLARRTFRHAEELHRIGARDEAIEALGKCLTWDPEHPGAEALSRRLGRDVRNRRGRGDVLD
ncbi:Hsp70 family protein [Streptomyces aureoverticillatus]|uniref:Hsp70 family protein n=1 Tax=Streptomyces aureoverticillatus TaxID=66871 RepID=UPI0013DC2BD4|nr:Hsp70 family protein [Streptomyces aureoverticillatus]QIB42932.1 Hsp70 family protein [Streptomyces aureoverticillatus]